MSITDRLSSQVGSRAEQANRAVVARCLAQPALLQEIAAGLASRDAALMGDCAEVLTQVAENHPDLVAPFAKSIIALLHHPNTRVRWEAMHALANIAATAPKQVAPLLDQLMKSILCDTSVIVRDHAVRAIGNFASTSHSAAKSALPFLTKALAAWDGKHAALALQGLTNVVRIAPTYSDKILALAKRYLTSDRGVVRKAASLLVKTATAEKSQGIEKPILKHKL
jgi:hypothetical protein